MSEFLTGLLAAALVLLSVAWTTLLPSIGLLWLFGALS